MEKLLETLVRIPSFSREEGPVADALQAHLTALGLAPRRTGHNLWCFSSCGGPDTAVPGRKPVLLLNAHLDTVRPTSGWTRDPFACTAEGDRLYGLGTNDDGASLVCLLEAFLRLKDTVQPYTLVFSATAEEEVSGSGGIEMILPEIEAALGPVSLGIMGEPTAMRLALAERGLMVLDCTAYGKSGHAARDEGVNALYAALPDIEWLRSYRFPLESAFLGPVRMSVTQIAAGTQHNVVPDRCSFVVDVRSNGLYTNEEILETVCRHLSSEVKARSTRLGSSHIAEEHPVVARARSLGLACFGSPTTSNQALVRFPTVKIGPGDSARSHTADEYVTRSELQEGAALYVRLLTGLQLN